MSKLHLKKELQKLKKEQLVEQIIELYVTYKPVKEYYKTFLNPENIEEICEKYKGIIVNEFFPNGKSRNPKLRFSEAKNAITDFRALKPPPKLIADLMVTLAENAWKFFNDYGDMPEQFYKSALNNFERALIYLHKERLLNDFKKRCETCLTYSQDCGYGFTEEMYDVFNKFYE